MTTKLRAASFQNSLIDSAMIPTNAITSARIAADAITNAKIADDAVQTENFASTVNLGRRNIVINGAMQVAQRNTTQASIGGNNGYWTVDRYYLYAPHTAGRLTMSQDTDTPNGFGNSIKFDCTTADTSIAANEYMLLEQSFEGQDVQQFKKGTSEAEQITVSFYMKTNKAFTFMCELNDFDNNRVNTQQFTTSTSWTRHILTFAGDTSGALDNDTNKSFGVGIWMHGGSNFTGGTYSANTWQSRASSDNMRAVGIGSFFDSTDNLVRITGLQLEVGSQATSFEHRSFGEEKMLCYRYYYKTNQGNHMLKTTSTGTNGDYYWYYYLPIPMRASPTCTVDGGSDNYNHTASPSVMARGSLNMANINVSKTGGAANAYFTLDGITADAEL